MHFEVEFLPLQLINDVRCRVLTEDSLPRYMIPCITITRFLTLNIGRSYTVILVSLVM